MSWSHRAETDIGVLECVPLTPDRFADMESVFDQRRVTQKCFCMHWRKPDGGYEDERDNRERFADIAVAGPPPGLLGYIDGEPVGWVQVGPRSDFPTLGRSRLFEPVDDKDPWTINCFVVHPDARGRRVGKGLLDAAIQYAAGQGADVLEAYPVDGQSWTPVNFFTGTLPMFAEHGFVEVVRRNDTRPIVRLTL